MTETTSSSLPCWTTLRPETPRETTGVTPLNVEEQSLQIEEEQELPFFCELLRFAKNRNWKKKLLTAFVVISSAVILIDLIFFTHVRTAIVAALEWMTQNPFGAVFSVVGFIIVATLLFVPPALLIFASGYAFADITGDFWLGVLTSAVISYIGCCLGAIAAFLRSRYMMRELTELFAKRFPIVKALDSAFTDNGFKVMLLLRLCPIIPFNGLNYIGGVTSISLKDFTLAMVGILPTVLLWTFCGAATDHLTTATSVEGNGPQLYLIILLSSGLAFAIIAAILIWKFSVEALKKEMDAEAAESWCRYKKTSEEGAAALDMSVSTIEPSQECTMQEHEQLHSPMGLHWLGISAHGLEGHYEGSEDGRDEEWFWLWS